MKRQKIVEREYFSEEEKMAIAQKSDERCCHCGKKVYFGYGATVEHFIPLSKGGTNRNINLVMLCKDCNEQKGNFIYDPEDYLTYLNKEHLDEIKGYFDSYIKSFEFVNRDNLLACDRYKHILTPAFAYNNPKLANIITSKGKSFWTKRATYDDIDRLTEYFIRYLKKYDSLDDPVAARVNIKFWLSFGCIYYVEDNFGDIKCLFTITASKIEDNYFNEIQEKMGDQEMVKDFLTMNIFTYYSTDVSFSVAYNVMRKIPNLIMHEQGLKRLPIKFCILKKDKLCYSLMNIYKGGHGFENRERFAECFVILHYGDDNILCREDEKLIAFFNRFRELNTSRLEKWFEENADEPYDWMIREIDIKNLEDDDK